MQWSCQGLSVGLFGRSRGSAIGGLTRLKHITSNLLVRQFALFTRGDWAAGMLTMHQNAIRLIGALTSPFPRKGEKPRAKRTCAAQSLVKISRTRWSFYQKTKEVRREITLSIFGVTD